MKIERETDHDETTQALTDTIADALASETNSVLTECSDGLSRVQLRVGTRRFELRLMEVL
jgi:hypothetical protein